MYVLHNIEHAIHVYINYHTCYIYKYAALFVVAKYWEKPQMNTG